MDNKFEYCLKHYIFTKYIYLLFGIAFSSLMLPKGLSLLGVNLPSLFSSVVNNVDFVQIENILILISKIFLCTFFVLNFLIMFIFIRNSQANTFFRLSNLIALLIPTIYIASTMFNFMGKITEFLDNDLFKYSILCISISVILFIIGTIFTIVKESDNPYKPSATDFISLIMVIAFSVLYLIGYKKLFSIDIYFFECFVTYFYLAIYTFVMGMFQMVLGSKSYLNLKD